MGRKVAGKVLKRVNGDVYLAPMKFEPGRPITSGAPLRRCSNDTSLRLSTNDRASVTTTPVVPLKRRNSSRKERERQQQVNITKTVSENLLKLGRRQGTKFPGELLADIDESKKSVTISSSPTQSEKYMVPTNTAITSTATKSRSTFLTPGESNTSRFTEAKHINSNRMCIYDDPTTPSLHTYSSEFSAMSIDDTDCYRMINPKKSIVWLKNRNESCMMKAANYNDIPTSYTEELSDVEVGRTPVEKIMTTGTSLSLPVVESSETLSPATRSEDSDLDSKLLLEFSGKNRQIRTETPEIASSSKAGDGDTLVRSQQASPGNEDVNEEDTNTVYLPVPPPPVSVATNPSFVLTFKKPKPRPRPRSIVTSSSGNKASLPTTASTPNPISPPVVCTPKEEMKPPRYDNRQQSINENNNNEASLVDANNNNDKEGSIVDSEKIEPSCSRKVKGERKLSKSAQYLNKSPLLGTRNFEAFQAEIADQPTNPPADPADVVTYPPPPYPIADATTYPGADDEPYPPVTYPPMPYPPPPAYPTADAEEHDSELPPEHVDAVSMKGTGVYEPDASFWHSDSSPTPSENSKQHKGHHKKHKHHHGATTATTRTETYPTYTQTKSTDKYYTESGSQYSSEYGSSQYPYSSEYSNGYGGSSYQSDGPFLRTEKGAIRFHLPGRIQHKTTIKVAHFPTNEDTEKTINLNLKADKGEEDPCEEIPSAGVNNQNFIIPPQPTTYNPYNSYGYGGGGSPYSMEDYYRYYGYPSPYC